MWPANLALLIYVLTNYLKQFKSLTTIETLICHSGLYVTHQTALPEVPGSIPGSDKDLYVCFFWFVVVVFNIWTPKWRSLFVKQFCNSFCNVALISILNILRSMWSVQG